MSDRDDRLAERNVIAGDTLALEKLLHKQRRRGDERPMFSVAQLMIPKPKNFCAPNCEGCKTNSEYDWDHESRFNWGRTGLIKEFTTNKVEVIDTVFERDYQGSIWGLMKINLVDGIYAIYRDYFGSCGGCDGFIDATPSEKYDYTKSTLGEGNCRTFWSLSDICDYLLTTDDYHWNPKDMMGYRDDYYEFLELVWKHAERDDLPKIDDLKG